MSRLRILAITALMSLITQDALAQPQAQRFERSLQQIRDQTLGVVNPAIPPDQRVTFDYGGYLSFGYLSLDDNVNDNHGLRQSEIVLFARANFDGAHEFFIRYSTGYRDFNQGDSFDGLGSQAIDGGLDACYYKFDLARYEAAYRGKQIDNDLTVKVGQDLVYWENGLTLSQVIQGGMIDLTLGNLTLSVISGVTPTRTVDFYSSRPAFDYNTNRGFYGTMATLNVNQQKPYIYGLIQRDYNKDFVGNENGITTRFNYNSWYLGIGSTGPITDRMLYGVEAVYEGGQSLSNSFTLNDSLFPTQVEQVHDTIQAWAADARIDYVLADPHHTRLSGEMILASGDDDRVNTSTTYAGNRPNTNDHAFNAFGLLNTGLAFAPSVSNMLAFRVGASTFPFDFGQSFRRVQMGTDIFLFNKLNRQGGIDEPSDDGARFLGWEPDIYLNWQITSDVTFSGRYGVFFPDGSALATNEARQFLYLNIIYSF